MIQRTQPKGRRAWRVMAAAAMLLASCAPAASPTVTREAATGAPVAIHRFSGAPAATPAPNNAAFTRDLLDLHFRLESGRAVPRLTRFEGPVTVGVEGRSFGTLDADLDDLIGRLRHEARIDIARAAPGRAPRITVSLQPRARLAAAVPGAACFVVPGVSGWAEFRASRGAPHTDWTRIPTRTTASIFLPRDMGPQEARDCLHEEMAQALGPLNDLFRLAHSTFNDDNAHVVLTDWDMLALRATYDPALRSGMTRREAARALPGVLARINPRGRGAGRAGPDVDDAAWLAALRAGSRADGTPAARLRHAERAVLLAREAGGHRLGVSLMALGRARIAAQPAAARATFAEAEALFRDLHGDGVHAAQAALQVAAFDLSAGQPAAALARLERSVPAARGAQNAALLATLSLLRAEAAARVGRPHARLRAEGMAWGRYAWGVREAAQRAGEVAALGAGA